MKKSYLIVVISLIFSGCGGSSSDKIASIKNQNNSIKPTLKTIDMKKDRAYIIKKGDKIEKISSNPVIKMQSELGSDKTTVTLISGKAKIIKN
jgi:uncharacterized protein YcfL